MSDRTGSASGIVVSLPLQVCLPKVYVPSLLHHLKAPLECSRDVYVLLPL